MLWNGTAHHEYYNLEDATKSSIGQMKSLVSVYLPFGVLVRTVFKFAFQTDFVLSTAEKYAERISIKIVTFQTNKNGQYFRILNEFI